MKIVNIYTDGGCSNNQSDINFGGWGAILEYNNVTKELYGSEANTTNNRMEMTALIEGLKALKEKKIEVNIYSDSSYLIECFRNRWYDKWLLNGWKTSTKKPVENKDLWETLLSLVNSFEKISFNRVKGHLDINKESELKKWYKKYQEYNGNIDYRRYVEIVNYNNRADELANVGIDEIKSPRK
ncbi:MAG: RNase H family protein [Bacillota bacterium]|nr:RNase H family protein [Bacillota bacterium]